MKYLDQEKTDGFLARGNFRSEGLPNSDPAVIASLPLFFCPSRPQMSWHQPLFRGRYVHLLSAAFSVLVCFLGLEL